MSHFTVTVRLTRQRLDRHEGDLDAALEEILAPFNEQPEQGSPYLKFDDKTAEVVQEYAEGTIDQVRLPDGTLVSPYDERFKVSKGPGWSTDPEGAEKVAVPFAQVYRTVEVFATEYKGYEARRGPGPEEVPPDARVVDVDHPVRFGYVRNGDVWVDGRLVEGAKWDWYQIGGRWRGHFPLKPGKVPLIGKAGTFDNEAPEGCGDVVKVSDIDFDTVAEKTRVSAKDFLRDWRRYLAGEPEKDWFFYPRSKAMEIGLCRVVQGSVAVGDLQPGEVARPWADDANFCLKEGDSRRSWVDVVRVPEDEAAFVRACGASFSPLSTYAALDDDGWHAPGEMGWFGCSSDEPEHRLAFDRAFVERFIRVAGSEDVLVCCDLHI